MLTHTRLSFSLSTGIILLGTLLMLDVPGSLDADESAGPQRMWADIKCAAEESIEEQNLAGLSIGVVHKGDAPFAAGFGYADVEARTPVGADSLFHTASISKLFVATSLMQLSDADRVDLDAPVERYLPYFPITVPEGSSITIRQMLSHASGIPDVEDYGWDHPEYDPGAASKYIRSLTGTELIDEPGNAFHYSNLAYDMLGQLIAEVSGMSFEEYVRTSILEPLGMNSSSFLYADFDTGRLTSPHLRADDGEGIPVLHHTYPYNRIHAPSSTLASTAEDMDRWMLSQLNRGELDGNRVLPESAYDELWKPWTEIRGTTWVGLSWFHTVYEDLDLYYHSGGDPGFSGVCILVPEMNLGVTVLTNTDRAKVVGIALKIIDLYIN